MIFTLTNPKSRFLIKTRKSAYSRNLVWVYVVSESLGIGCMAMFAAFPSTIVEAAFGRLHNQGAGASGARSIVVESIVVDGKAGNMGIRPMPNDSLTTYTHTKFRL